MVTRPPRPESVEEVLKHGIFIPPSIVESTCADCLLDAAAAGSDFVSLDGIREICSKVDRLLPEYLSRRCVFQFEDAGLHGRLFA